MFCLKCGKEIGEKAVFCGDCLAVMEKHPVKPDAKIFLPHPTAPSVVKKAPSRRRVLTAEEKLPRMRKTIQLLCIMLSVALIALALSVALLIESTSTEPKQDAIGQNYGTIDKQD